MEKNLKAKTNLETKKELAKIGMSVSMGLTVLSSFSMKSKTMKNIHLGAGFALVGFSFWHYALYEKDKPSKRAKSKKQEKPS